MNGDKDHEIETYKSLISIAVEGLKSVLLLNGGAIVALLAYLGQSSLGAHLAIRIKDPLALFVVGLISVGFAFITCYMTQFALYNQTVNSKTYKGLPHQVYLVATLILVIISLGSFSCGAFSAVNALSIGAKV